MLSTKGAPWYNSQQVHSTAEQDPCLYIHQFLMYLTKTEYLTHLCVRVHEHLGKNVSDSLQF